MGRESRSTHFDVWAPICAGFFLVSQSIVRIYQTHPERIELWLVATLLGGLGATLVGIDHFRQAPEMTSSVVSDVTLLIPYGITAVSVIVGVSVYFA